MRILRSSSGTRSTSRRYPEAIEAYRHASPLPRTWSSRVSRGLELFPVAGQLDTLRSLLRELPLELDPGGEAGRYHQRLLLLLWERRPDSLLSLLPVILPHPTRPQRPS